MPSTNTARAELVRTGQVERAGGLPGVAHLLGQLADAIEHAAGVGPRRVESVEVNHLLPSEE
jgi:hypothetical protein